MEKYGKTVVFPGSYGRIGEILHGQLWPDLGLYGAVLKTCVTNKPYTCTFGV